jgi:hypothetical protein
MYSLMGSRGTVQHGEEDSFRRLGSHFTKVKSNSITFKGTVIYKIDCWFTLH